jgi:hypothetical protein
MQTYMQRDTIASVPDSYIGLGKRRAPYRYNGFEFQLEAKAHPLTRTTQEYSNVSIEKNLEANIRKGLMGLGKGQYLRPDDVKRVQNGTVMLTATVAGRVYSIPLTVNADNEYTTDIMPRSKFTSLRDVATKVMDGVLRANHIAIDAKVAPHVAAARNAQMGGSMRM